MTTRVDYWNHNVHYQPVILKAVPADCGAALEVGCGDGLLARRLAERCRRGHRDRPGRADDRAGREERNVRPGPRAVRRGGFPRLPGRDGQLRLRLREHRAAPHGLRGGADAPWPARCGRAAASRSSASRRTEGPPIT